MNSIDSGLERNDARLGRVEPRFRLEKKAAEDPLPMTLTSGLMLILALLLAGCGTLQIWFESPADSSEQPVTPVASLPADDTLLATPTDAPPPAQGPGPDLVWTLYATGVDENNDLIVMDDGMIGFSPSPLPFQIFFDYSPINGRLVYGSEFWHPAAGSNQGVTDLWVYHYASGQASQWLSDNVGRAIWSPTGGALAVAVFNPGLGIYELGTVGSDGRVDILASCASTSLSWSPDGHYLAYEAGGGVDDPSPADECRGIYVIELNNRSVVKISDSPPATGGWWHGDQPIWAEGQEALLLTYGSIDSVFAVVPLDGSGVFTVTKSDAIEIEYLPNPLQTVWSQEHNSVVGQTEGMFDPNGVWVYRFSDDMRVVEDAYRVTIDGQEPALILIGWWEPGESVLMRDISNTSAENPFGRALVYSLSDRSWFPLPLR
jgi:hypothetical protein